MSLSLKELEHIASEIKSHNPLTKTPQSKPTPITTGTGGKGKLSTNPKPSLKLFLPIALLIAGIGTYMVFFGGAAPVTANLWVAPGGSANCTRSDSPSAYVAGGANVCDTINNAWGKCQNTKNDTVVIKPFTGGGSYPSQSISGNKTASGCAIIGESGTNIGVLNINADYFSLENVTVIAPDNHGSGGLGVSANNVTLKNVNLHGQYVSADIGGADHFEWLGGEMGEIGKVPGKRKSGGCGIPVGDPEPVQISNTTFLTIDGVTFHPQDADLTHTTCDPTGFHLEMVRIQGANSNLTMRNSTFDNGDHSNTSSIFITTNAQGAAAAHDLVFENNYFGTNDSSPGAFDVHDYVTACNNMTFAYNTFVGGTGAFQCATSSKVKWIGNLGPNSFNSADPCPDITETMYTNNVWQHDYDHTSSKANCGTDGVTPGFGGSNPGADTQVQGTAFQTDALGLGGADGFHLQPGSKAIDKGESVGGYCTTTLGSRDHDGGGRPVPSGGRCDAGAHEFGSVPASGGDSIVPTVSLTAPAGGSTLSGSMAVSANASDNVGVAGVQFKLDGNNIGTEDTSSPYSINWDSATTTNGSHTLTASARDSKGNSSTSAGVAVMVSNATSGGNTLYISQTGSNSGACSQASPCRTMGYAYAHASTTPGSTIIINAGFYGNDTIAYKANMSGNPVVVKPATGATVNFTDITEKAEYVTFQGPNFNARTFYVGCDSGCSRINNVVVDGLNIDAQDKLNTDAMYVTKVTHFTLKNSRVGNTMAGAAESDTAKSVMFCGGSSTCQAEDVLFEGNTFYDADAPTGSAAHLECIFATGVQGFTVRKNRFQDCTYFDIFITVILANNQPQPKDYIIEDNLMGHTLNVAGAEAHYAIAVHGDVVPNNFQFLRNTIEGNLATGATAHDVTDPVTLVKTHILDPLPAGQWLIAGNIVSEGVWTWEGGSQQCRANITFSYNVMPNNCGTNTYSATAAAIKAGWVSQKGPYAGDDDFRLLATSPAINRGVPAYAGTADFVGVTRANPPDAGAYEYVTTGGGSTCSTKPGNANTDSVVNIQDIATVLSNYGKTVPTGTTNCADVNNDKIINIQDIAYILGRYGT